MQRECAILSTVACPTLHISTLSHKWQDYPPPPKKNHHQFCLRHFSF